MQKKTHKKVRFPELLAVILNLNITRAGFSQKKNNRKSTRHDSVKNPSY